MPNITLTFDYLNETVSVGDTVYYASTTSSGGFNVQSDINEVIKMGPVSSISGNSIVVDCADNVDVPTTTDFILFSKDNAQQLSSIVGYYAEIKLKNDSTEKAEIFRVAMSAVESSK